jgi:CrcB protein
MPNFIYVMIGGAAGAGLRYEIGRVALRHAPGFPWGTLAVNVLGGLFMGLLAGALFSNGGVDRPVWLLLGAGLLGGFTTFSAFSFELFLMLQRGEATLAATYALASVLGALALLMAGYAAARALA